MEGADREPGKDDNPGVLSDIVLGLAIALAAAMMFVAVAMMVGSVAN